MPHAIRPTGEDASVAASSRSHRARVVARALLVAAVAAAVSWCIARAAAIPASVMGNRTMVAVEPLLRSLNIGYSIEGSVLDVDGRRYDAPLEEHGGVDYVDAYAIARFLHLRVTDRNGTFVYTSEAPAGVSEPTPPTPDDLQAVRDALLAALNAHRSLSGDDPLVVDPIAQSAAQDQALDMARAAQMRHEDAQGRTPMERYDGLGGHAAWYAENVGWYGLDATDRKALADAVGKLDAEMMAEQPPDDGHRRNILSPRYQAVGLGICVGPSGIYLAEDFVGH